MIYQLTNDISSGWSNLSQLTNLRRFGDRLAPPLHSSNLDEERYPAQESSSLLPQITNLHQKAKYSRESVIETYNFRANNNTEEIN